MPPDKVKRCLSRMSGKLSRTVLRRGKGSNPFSLVDYTSKVFKKKLDVQHITQSMSRPGKCIDNGPMEGFFGTLKSEMFYGKKFNSYEELIKSIHEYIYYYNNQRFQAKLKNMAPIEYRSHALM